MPLVDPAWVLSLMTYLEPASPFRTTFEATANAVANAAERSPLPSLDARRTASVLVALAWFESRFQIDAKGDCSRVTKLGTCAEGGVPTSFGLFQINVTNHDALAVTASGLLSSPETSADAALRMMCRSFHVCRARPLEERLAWYAGGGNGCPEGGPTRKSRHRMALAVRLAQR